MGRDMPPAPPLVQRLDSAILLQGSVLAEVRWVLQRGVREIWRADSIAPSARITALLTELATITTSPLGTEEVRDLDDSRDLITETVSTLEAARLLGIGPRQVRNFSGRLGGHKVGGVLTFDLAAVQAEAARRKEVA